MSALTDAEWQAIVERDKPTGYGFWLPEPDMCCICEQPGFYRDAVPYYCAPVLEGHSEGGYKVACPNCYERWERWSSMLLARMAGGV